MGEFVNLLRKAKIKAPNTRDWSDERWTSDFSRIPEPDAADRLVFDAGLWFGGRLSASWRDVQALDLAKYDRSEVHSKITLLINLMATETLAANSPLTDEYSGDHLFTSFGDTLNRALSYLASIAEFGREPVSDETLDRCLGLFNGIYVLEFTWDRVLWAGWGATSVATGVSLAPMTTEAEQMLHHEAIAEFLRQIEGQQMQLLYANEWAAGQHRDVSPPVIRLLRYQVPRASFAVEDRPVDTMPAYLPHLLSDLPNWLEPMLSRPVSELDDNGLIEVVNAWRLLYDAVGAILKVGEVGLLHIDDATALITAVRPRLSHATARKIVDFLVLDPTKRRGDGVWGAPFVRLSREILCPVIPCLMHPNIQRMTDLWGERCTSEQLLIFRGGLWEQHLRDSLVAGFKEAHWNEDWWVHPSDLKRWGHQIDLLLRIGKLVVVGETKFAKYPCIPAEFGRFFQETLDYGATQADSRRQAVEANRDELAKLCRYKGSPHELIILPLVVSPYFLGSGLKIRGVDCVSYDDLLHFFVKDRLPLGEINDKGMNAVANLRFRRENERIDDALLRYLKQPPQTFFYSQAVEHVERRFTSPQNPEMTISWLEGTVKLPAGAAGFSVFAQRVEALWNMEVLEAPDKA